MYVPLGILIVIVITIVVFFIMNAIGTFLYKVISGEPDPVKAAITAEDVNRFGSILERFTYFNYLSKEGKRRFLQRTVDFMRSKKFDGRDGLQVTEEMKVLVSASAAQLLFGLDEHRLTGFYNIRIFPAVFYSRLMNVHMKGGTTRGGVIMLSWKDFLQGYANGTDKLNLGLHELAHALRIEVDNGDDYSGIFAGYMEHWDLISNETFQKVKNDEVPFLRKYAGTNRQEFWAVCVEHFFEAPEEFNRALPKIYRYMCVMLNQDPENVHGDYSIEKELIPSAKELINLTPAIESEEVKIQEPADAFSIIAAILVLPLSSGLLISAANVVMQLSTIFLMVFLGFITALFLAKRFLISGEKISPALLFKSLVLGGMFGSAAFIFLNNAFTVPLSAEIYKIKNVWTQYGGDGGQKVTGYEVDLEGNAYSDYAFIRTFENKPGSQFVKFEFANGLFGVKVLKSKAVTNARGEVITVPSFYDNLTRQVDSLSAKGDTAALRKMFNELGNQKNE